MPDYDSHKKQAYHNRDVATYLLVVSADKDFHDWIVTACFYASIHLVEAMTAKNSHLLVPGNTFPRYERKAMVKQKGMRHTADAEKFFAKTHHELRTQLIKANMWYFKDAGEACVHLRRESETARYECQQITAQDADGAMEAAKNAFLAFESWEPR